MAPALTGSQMGHISSEADLTLPATPSSDLGCPKSFRANFEDHIPVSRKPIKHASASVLLLSYDSQDENYAHLNVEKEVKELGEAFQVDYGFHVETGVIKNNQNSAQLQMFTHLSSFTSRREQEHALLIIYYAGHGWRSEDKSRNNPGRFDFYPRKLQLGEKPSGQELVMWESCELVLKEATGDVLVIFDCCDAGSLAKLRSPGRVFEYLGACEEDRSTHQPGDKSFTAALTWALRELKSKPHFLTSDLVAKIREHRTFPNFQVPVLFSRYDHPDHIWISSKQASIASSTDQRRLSLQAEFREEDCDYVDFRVTFGRRLNDEDGKIVAELMAPLVNNKKLRVNARHVAYLKKGSCRSLSPWNRTRSRIFAINQFQKSMKRPHAMLGKRKRRSSIEAQLDEDGWEKTKKPTLAIDTGHTTPTSLVPMDALQYPDSEGTVEGTAGSALLTAPRIIVSPDEMDMEAVDDIEGRRELLEGLRETVLHLPAVYEYFESQIRALGVAVD